VRAIKNASRVIIIKRAIKLRNRLLAANSSSPAIHFVNNTYSHVYCVSLMILLFLENACTRSYRVGYCAQSFSCWG